MAVINCGLVLIHARKKKWVCSINYDVMALLRKVCFLRKKSSSTLCLFLSLEATLFLRLLFSITDNSCSSGNLKDASDDIVECLPALSNVLICLFNHSGPQVFTY